MKVNNFNNTPQNLIKKNDRYANVPRPYLDFAKGQERIFTNHLLKQMRKSAAPTEQESSAQKYYKSIMDDELARIMSDSDSGIGIKDVVLDQIYPQYKEATKQQAINSYKKVIPNQGETNE